MSRPARQVAMGARRLVRARRAGPTTGLALLVLALSLAPARLTASEAGARQVAQAARACFAALQAQRFAEGLACLDTDGVTALHRRYLEQHVLPGYRDVPEELRAVYGADVRRETLAALPPVELLDAALRGALRLARARGTPVDALDVRVQATEHRIDEVYQLRVRVDLVVAGQRHGAEYAVPAWLRPDGVRLGVPAAVLEMLDVQ